MKHIYFNIFYLIIFWAEIGLVHLFEISTIYYFFWLAFARIFPFGFLSVCPIVLNLH